MNRKISPPSPAVSSIYKAAVASVFALGAAFSPAARASEGLFGYLYTVDTTPAGGWEYEQKHTFRSGKARGSYDALDLRNEFEYGVTDALQAAFYLNSSYLNSTGQYDPDDPSIDVPDRNEFDVDSASVELLYRALSPYKDGLGLAFYVEPELAVRDRMTGLDKIERSVEARVIVQKNFLDDTLIAAANVMAEPEWERVDGKAAHELWMEFTGGLVYRFAPNWFAGVEARNHMEFPDFNLGDQEHSAWFAGPTLHYGGEAWWWTLTALPQIAGWPRDLGAGADGQRISSSYAHLGQHESFEVRFMFGIPLGGEHSHAH